MRHHSLNRERFDTLLEAPVSLTGGAGTGTSVYVRDPDTNLLEFIVYENDER